MAHISITEEIVEALKSKTKPIVAIDTGILSRTLNYPRNLELTKKVLKCIQSYGVLPALIALIDGKIKVGLTEEEITQLAMLERYSCETSRRDLILSIYYKKTSRITLSSALLFSDCLGIKTLMTGSLTGVQKTNDGTKISSDIYETSRTLTNIVCSGLSLTSDISSSLQYLNSSSVSTVSFGENNDFPLFGCKKSSSQSLHCTTSIDELSNLINLQKILRNNGTLIVVPATSSLAFDCPTIENAVHQAIIEEETEKETSEDLNFLSDRVCEIVDFSSELMNSLYLENAKLASLISLKLK